MTGPATGTTAASALPVYSTRDQSLLTITLNRPDQRNALTRDMLTRLVDETERAAQDPDVGLVLLRGAGRDFCTGLDLDEFYAGADLGREQHRREAEELAALFTRIHRMPKPTVTLVHGRALGIGATLAVASDVVVASSAAQFGFPEVTLGFLPAFAGALLVRSVGPKAAFELLATGRTVRADEAHRMGLVSRVVPEEGWEAIARTQVKHLCQCAFDLGPALKQLFSELEDRPFEDAMRMAADTNARARASAAFRAAAEEFRSMA